VIGVIAQEHETKTVEEFFQLFKVPWEFYRSGASYDIILISGPAPDGVMAQLILIYDSNEHSTDRQAGTIGLTKVDNAKIDWKGNQIPLYGQLLTFGPIDQNIVCATAAADVAAIELKPKNPRVIRLGFNLFEEIEFLLDAGQPVENALIPSLDLHIGLLRDLILGSGISLIEIPPVPTGHDFAVCLTHDIDFVGIRRHKFDHTMWGFLYRSTIGAIGNFLRGKTSFHRLLQCWKAAIKLPFVFLGWARDFWMPFEWYLEVEKNLSPTYFFIPFKRRQGENVTVSHADRRGCAYDITDIPDWIARLQAEGCEIGVHGIDAWHSVEKGREELNRVATIAGTTGLGIRSHWLLRDGDTYGVLEKAGYSYDSTCGYNETPGYRSGTTQVFRPPGARELLELPMHIQDGALFFHDRLELSEAEAERQCSAFIESAAKRGGVLTVLWHDRSHGPERFWGEFYVELLRMLKRRKVWFGTAAEVIAWFRKRREISFKVIRGADDLHNVNLCGRRERVTPPFRVRIHTPGASGEEIKVVDIAWDGDCDFNPYPTVAANVA